MSHNDIRIGTLVSAPLAVSHIKQILPHGFESFSVTFWQKIGDISLEKLAAEVQQAVGDKAVISSLGMFGNPLMDHTAATDFGRCIDAAKLFNCDIVACFAGCIEGKPLPDSMHAFKKVGGKLAKQAEDRGVRIAWENCDMGGWWHDPRWNMAHSPTAWEMMFNEIPSDSVGLEWEPAHQLESLIDPLPQLRTWAKKIFHIQIG